MYRNIIFKNFTIFEIAKIKAKCRELTKINIKFNTPPLKKETPITKLPMQNKPNTIEQFYDYFLTTSLTPTGLAWASGAWWKEQRTFALTTLRKFGFGKRCLQSQVIEEVDCLMDEFEKYEGKPFNIHYQLKINF